MLKEIASAFNNLFSDLPMVVNTARLTGGYVGEYLRYDEYGDREYSFYPQLDGGVGPWERYVISDESPTGIIDRASLMIQTMKVAIELIEIGALDNEPARKVEYLKALRDNTAEVKRIYNI